MNQKQYSITVTTGLIKRLNDAEIESVLGHELTHIRNGDVRLMVIAVIIAGVVSFAGEMIFRILFNSGSRSGSYSTGGSSSSSSSGSSWGGGSSSGSSDKKGGGGAIIVIVIALVLIALAWLLSVVIKMALSRSREMLADAGSVELTKNPDAMITALRKIEGRGELPGATSAVMEMCVDNPREEFADLFATHPSVDSRVAALVKFAGGHDPGKIDDPEPQTAGLTADDTQTEAPARQEAIPGAIPGPWDRHGDLSSRGGNDSHGAGTNAGSGEPPSPWGTAPKR
jgi:heat shock protein HtpX